ncbi:MAG TPA: hypothetical protein VN200_01835 [Rhodoglobus sp.]|nr:hypothetical protein [Rhodoglobus sp.]
MSDDLSRRTNSQWLLTAVGAGALMAGLGVYFFVQPLDLPLLIVAGVLIAVGVVVGLVALWRATRLLNEGGPARTIGLVSIVILVADPLLITALGLLL